MAGAPDDVSFMSNTHTPSISLHYFPKDVAVWPKWTRFDRRHLGDFALQCRRHHAPYGFKDACYEHISLVKSGEDNQWIQLERMLIKGSVPAPYTIVQHSFRLTFRKRRIVSSLLMFISRVWDILILLVFPHDYICAFLVVWKSYHFFLILVFLI